MNVMIEYANGVTLNYQLTAFGVGPSDGMLLGTHGRLQTNGGEKPEVTTYYKEPYQLTFEEVKGGHGGGDPLMFKALFTGDRNDDPLGHISDYRDGAWSALIGIAANQSIETGEVIDLTTLVDGLEPADIPVGPSWPPELSVQEFHDYINK